MLWMAALINCGVAVMLCQLVLARGNKSECSLCVESIAVSEAFSFIFRFIYPSKDGHTLNEAGALGRLGHCKEKTG